MEFQRILRQRAQAGHTVPASEPRRQQLRVGAVDDPAEREADRVADGVMAALAGPGATGSPITAGATRIRRRAAPRAPQHQAAHHAPDAGSRIRRAAHAGPIGPEGGAVDDDVARRLAATRGGGRRLDGDTRANMEQAFGGTDFGVVRVHQGTTATALNESLGARAFTLGQDIYVRGGLDVHRSNDQRMLAHELAHTVQQRGGAAPAARTIRRAVGFEFEVGSWSVEDLGIQLTDAEKDGTDEVEDDKVDFRGLTKDTVLHAGNNFNLKPDQADDGTWHLEFVVEPPFPENAKARSRVKTAIKDLRKLGDAMVAARGLARIRREGSPFTWLLSEDLGLNRPGVLISPRAKMEAEPQVTGGVRLDQLAEVMEKMTPTALPGETQKQTTERTTGAYFMGAKSGTDTALVAASPALVRQLYATFPGKAMHTPDTPSKELVGLLALIRTYLVKADQGAAYAKSIAPIMARTDFARIYKAIPEAIYYKSYPDQFADLALHCSGFAGQGGVPFFAGGSDYVDVNIWQAIQNALTRRQWLRYLPDGIDRATVDHFPDQRPAVCGQLFGLGKLGSKTDTVGKVGGETETEAPIFEFRRMAGFQDHRVWEPLTLELFDYFVAVNQRKKRTTFKAGKTAKKSRAI